MIRIKGDNVNKVLSTIPGTHKVSKVLLLSFFQLFTILETWYMLPGASGELKQTALVLVGRTNLC